MTLDKIMNIVKIFNISFEEMILFTWYKILKLLSKYDTKDNDIKKCKKFLLHFIKWIAESTKKRFDFIIKGCLSGMNVENIKITEHINVIIIIPKEVIMEMFTISNIIFWNPDEISPSKEIL